MASDSRIKLDGLDALRGIAAMVVVLHHAFGIVALPQNYNIILLGNLFSAGHLGVDVFFVLSGFVIAYSNQKGGRSSHEISLYALRRLARIFPIYWFACLIFFPLYFFFSRGAEGDFSPSRVVGNLLLLPSQEYPIIGVAWTLRFELMFYLLFIPLLWSRKVGVAIWGGLTVAIVLAAATGHAFNNAWTAQLLSPYVLEFLGGIMVWKLSSVYIASRRSSKFYVAAGFILMAGVVAFELKLGRAACSWNLMYAAASLPVVYGLVCLSSLDQGTPRIRTDWQKMLGTLGRYSYSVYLFHYPIEQIAVRIFLEFTGNAPGIGTVWLVVVVSTGLGLGAGLLAGHYVEMPLLEWCKKRIAGLKLNTRTAVREA